MLASSMSAIPKSTKPRILIVTPEITYLPSGMGNMTQRMSAKAGGLADVSASLVSANMRQNTQSDGLSPLVTYRYRQGLQRWSIDRAKRLEPQPPLVRWLHRRSLSLSILC